MAEAATKSKGQQRYGNGPKVKPKGNASQGTDTTNTTSVAATPGAAPEATEAAGTDGIPVTERHTRERGEMGERHASEIKDAYKRHAKEHTDLMTRHMAEAATLTGGEPAPAEAKA